MTEDEARKRWCPFARSRVVPFVREDTRERTEAQAQDPSDNYPSVRCIASACMAWRWDEPWTSQTEEGHGGDLIIRLKRKPGEPKLGYCGLAGAPR